MKTALRNVVLFPALALAACRGDSIGTPQAVTPALLASEQAADPPRFSDWSAPVNLGPVVNTSFIDQGASVSQDGLSLYFQCGTCPATFVAEASRIWRRASVGSPWARRRPAGSTINTAANEQAPRLCRGDH